MATSWIEVADTAIKIGLGVIAGGAVSLGIEYFRHRAESDRRREDLRRERFVDPIVEFMDSTLAAIGELYWARLDGREARTAEKMAFFQERHGAIEARIHALNDAPLNEMWAPFTRKIAEVKIRLGERAVGDPYEKMTEAAELGGRILRRLFDLRE